MERLTRTINVRGNSIVVYTKGKYEDTTAAEMRNEDIREVMKKLAEYERTKLTPEQIRELKDRDTAKVPDDTDDEYDMYVCPSCNMAIGTIGDKKEHHFCLNCGQRITWAE